MRFTLALILLAAVAPVAAFGWPAAQPFSILLLVLLAALTVIDMRQMRLPDPLTLALAVSGLLATWMLWPSLLWQHLVAAAVTAVGLWGLSTLWWRLRGAEALGLGDVKLGAAAALWLGPAVSMAITLAAALGLLVALTGWTLGRFNLQQPLPFGPFLCFGLWTVWCWFAG